MDGALIEEVIAAGTAAFTLPESTIDFISVDVLVSSVIICCANALVAQVRLLDSELAGSNLEHIAGGGFGDKNLGLRGVAHQ